SCDDICSHAYASLSEGDINGAEVECPLHGALFNITTGEALTPPADAPIKGLQGAGRRRRHIRCSPRGLAPTGPDQTFTDGTVKAGNVIVPGFFVPHCKESRRLSNGITHRVSSMRPHNMHILPGPVDEPDPANDIGLRHYSPSPRVVAVAPIVSYDVVLFLAQSQPASTGTVNPFQVRFAQGRSVYVNSA
ncbi:Naphthalene 1,2-dioxygenase system, ferredoxin component (Fragment), partial [Geodia barretti]